MRILLTEHDAKLWNLINVMLIKSKVRVDWVIQGDTAMKYAMYSPDDVIVLANPKSNNKQAEWEIAKTPSCSKENGANYIRNHRSIFQFTKCPYGSGHRLSGDCQSGRRLYNRPGALPVRPWHQPGCQRFPGGTYFRQAQLHQYSL